MIRKNLFRFGSVAALAAGMAFAQTQAPASGQATAPATPAAPAKPGVHRTFREQFRQRMMNELNLSPEQRDQAKVIFQHARQSSQPFRQQLRTNREAMTVAVKADDAGRIRQLATERGRLLGDLMAIHSEAAAKFYANLTPAQRTKADLMHQRFEQRWHERMGPRTNGTPSNG